MAQSTIKTSELIPNAINISAENNATLSGQASFSMGRMVCLIFRFVKGTSATIGTVPAGYRPSVTASTVAIAPATGDLTALAIGSAGNVVAGSNCTNAEYRVNITYPLVD